MEAPGNTGAELSPVQEVIFQDGVNLVGQSEKENSSHTSSITKGAHIMGRFREKMDFRLGLIQQLNNTIKPPVFFQALPSRMAALSLSSLPHGGKRASRVLTLATTIIFPFDIW